MKKNNRQKFYDYSKQTYKFSKQAVDKVIYLHGKYNEYREEKNKDYKNNPYYNDNYNYHYEYDYKYENDENDNNKQSSFSQDREFKKSKVSLDKEENDKKSNEFAENLSKEIKSGVNKAYHSILERFRFSIVLKLNMMYFKRMFGMFISLNLCILFATTAFSVLRSDQILNDQIKVYSNYLETNKVTNSKELTKEEKKSFSLLDKSTDNKIRIIGTDGKEIYSSKNSSGRLMGKSHKVYNNRYVEFYEGAVNSSDKNPLFNSGGQNNKYGIKFLFKDNLSVKYRVQENVDIGKGSVLMDVSYDLTGDLWLIGSLIIVLFFIEFIIALLSLIKVSVRTKKILRPIDDMNRTVEEITINNIDTRLNIAGSQNELKDLANTFNGMLDRIQESYETQNQFVSDASHELRTPLTVIQGYAKMLNRWGKDDPDVLIESIAAIESESESMKALIEQLLFLARGDKNTQRFNRDMFKMNDLIDNLIKETNLIDEGRHIITCDVNESFNIYADRNLLKEALRVFLDNSIKYTKANGEIKISSYVADNKATIVIKDTGIGMSKEDLPRIFDRFYRADKSRTRETGGTGLGLPIAKWIVTKHGGTIDVTSKIDVGTTFMIKVPIE